jgi:hypothetical protein
MLELKPEPSALWRAFMPTRLARRLHDTAGHGIVPTSGIDFAASIEARLAEPDFAPRPATREAELGQLLDRLQASTCTAADLDPAVQAHIVPIALVAYAIAFPLEAGLARTGEPIDAVQLLVPLLRQRFVPAHGNAVRHSEITHASALFQGRGRSARPVRGLCEEIGELVTAWYVTGEAAYLEAIGERARRIADAV